MICLQKDDKCSKKSVYKEEEGRIRQIRCIFCGRSWNTGWRNMWYRACLEKKQNRLEPDRSRR
jgi:hypothetical protein